MSYQGNVPGTAPESVPQILDNLVFDGTSTAYTLRVGGSPIAPVNVSQLEISIGGVIQAPLVAYTVSGAIITFSAAPALGATFFGKLLGRLYDIGVPQDYTVTTNKIAAGAVTTDKIAVTSLPSIRPSLNLDFANSRTLDPRITFTRASTATRINDKGLVESVASGAPRIDFDPITLACKGLLIEEARTNLLTYSQDFDNASWNGTTTYINRNAAVAPDGTVTADKCFNSIGSPYGLVTQYPPLVANTVYVFSVYVKAAEVTTAQIDFYSIETGDCGFYIDLLTGATSNPFGSIESYGVIPAGNGWYRAWMKRTMAATVTVGQVQAYRYLGTGDGVSGYYVWGAQLEAGAFPTTYIPSTVTHTGRSSTATFIGSNGLIQTAASGVARYSYNPLNLSVPPALLLEESRTNLLTYSEQFDNAAWTKFRSSITPNAITAPDGLITADKLVEDTTASNTHVVAAASYTATNTRLCASIYVKAGERTKVYFEISNYLNHSASCIVNLVAKTATVTTVGSTDYTEVSASVQELLFSGGWLRVSVTALKGSANSVNVLAVSTIGTAGSVSYTGDGTSGLYIWGAQLEQGSYPTTYIPTTTAAVTRAADTSTSAAATRAAEVATMTGTNFSSWYRQDEGSFVVEFDSSRPADSTTGGEVFWAHQTFNDRIGVFNNTGWAPDRWHPVVISGGGWTFDPGASTGGFVGTPTSPAKMSFAYKANDFAVSSNGLSVATDNSGSIPSPTLLWVGNYLNSSQLCGHIANLSYYPKRVSNAELQALTA